MIEGTTIAIGTPFSDDQAAALTSLPTREYLRADVGGVVEIVRIRVARRTGSVLVQLLSNAVGRVCCVSPVAPDPADLPAQPRPFRGPACPERGLAWDTC